MSFKRELQLSKLKLDHPDESSFLYAQWNWPKPCYFLWKTTWLVWHLAWLKENAPNFSKKKARTFEEGPEWFIYYAHITVLLTAVACFLDFAHVTMATFCTAQQAPVIKSFSSSLNKSKHSEEVIFQGEFNLKEGLNDKTLPWNLKLLWFLYNCVFSSNLLATTWFWAAQHENPATALNIVFYSASSVFVITNLLISRIPIRLLHFVFPASYTAIYFLLSTNCSADIAVLSILVVIPALHLAVYALYTVRTYLHSGNSYYSMGYEPLENHTDTEEFVCGYYFLTSNPKKVAIVVIVLLLTIILYFASRK